jgi:hypothetical protein
LKKYYEWGRYGLKRIEILGPEDTAKKPEIPTGSKFARIHDKVLRQQSKRKRK